MADPGYVMLWAENMPFLKGSGRAECEVAAGSLGGATSGPPPPDSWAADAGNDVGVFHATLPPGSSLELPAAAGGGAGVNRVAYVVEGPTPSAGGGAAALAGVRVGGTPAAPHGGRAAFQLDAARPGLLVGLAADAPGAATVHVLVLQGRPIGEPVAQSGPFVMNTRAEVDRAFDDYSRTRFGGWPWAEDAVAFDRAQGRFADVVPPGGGAKRRLLPPGAASEAEL